MMQQGQESQKWYQSLLLKQIKKHCLAAGGLGVKPLGNFRVAMPYSSGRNYRGNQQSHQKIWTFT